MADMIPVEWAVIEGVVLLAVAMLFLFKWIGTKDASVEGKVYQKCRDENLPCLEVVDVSTGHTKVYSGEKDDDGDPMFEIDGLPMKIDPSLCSGDSRPKRHGNGLNVWTYTTPRALPLSVNSMLAYNTIIRHRNDKAAFRLLSGVPNDEMNSLLRISKSLVQEVAPDYISKFELKEMVLPGEEKYYENTSDRRPTPMEINTFVEIIEQMKSYFAVLPIETGFYCMQAAFEATPYAGYSQEIERIKYIFEQKAVADAANNAKLMQYVVMFGMAVMAVTGLIAVLLVLAPK